MGEGWVWHNIYYYYQHFFNFLYVIIIMMIIIIYLSWVPVYVCYYASVRMRKRGIR